jgi:hypothetical protein
LASPPEAPQQPPGADIAGWQEWKGLRGAKLRRQRRGGLRHALLAAAGANSTRRGVKWRIMGALRLVLPREGPTCPVRINWLPRALSPAPLLARGTCGRCEPPLHAVRRSWQLFPRQPHPCASCLRTPACRASVPPCPPPR